MKSINAKTYQKIVALFAQATAALEAGDVAKAEKIGKRASALRSLAGYYSGGPVDTFCKNIESGNFTTI